MKLRPYDQHELYLWAAWAAAGVLSFAWLEWRGMRKAADADPTLTSTIRRYVPEWALALGAGAFEGWIHDHFFHQTYQKHA